MRAWVGGGEGAETWVGGGEGAETWVGEAWVWEGAGEEALAWVVKEGATGVGEGAWAWAGAWVGVLPAALSRPQSRSSLSQMLAILRLSLAAPVLAAEGKPSLELEPLAWGDSGRLSSDTSERMAATASDILTMSAPREVSEGVSENMGVWELLRCPEVEDRSEVSREFSSSEMGSRKGEAPSPGPSTALGGPPLPALAFTSLSSPWGVAVAVVPSKSTSMSLSLVLEALPAAASASGPSRLLLRPLLGAAAGLSAPPSPSLSPRAATAGTGAGAGIGAGSGVEVGEGVGAAASVGSSLGTACAGLPGEAHGGAAEVGLSTAGAHTLTSKVTLAPVCVGDRVSRGGSPWGVGGRATASPGSLAPKATLPSLGAPGGGPHRARGAATLSLTTLGVRLHWGTEGLGGPSPWGVLSPGP